MNKGLIGINIVDLYYCFEPKLMDYIYSLYYDNEYCVLCEKGLCRDGKIVYGKYLISDNVLWFVEGFYVKMACPECNPDGNCIMNCIVVNEHESHHLTCCVGHGIAGVLTVRAGCSKGCGEGVSAKEVGGELVCDDFFRCRPIDGLGCWLYCYR